MEPAQAQIIPEKIRYTMETRVKQKRLVLDRVHLTGTGLQAIFEDRPIGWLIQFEGSQESLNFGLSEPEFHVGQKVKIIFEIERLP